MTYTQQSNQSQLDSRPMASSRSTDPALHEAGRDSLPVVELFDAAARLTAADQTNEAIALYREWLSTTDSSLSYAVNFNLAILLHNGARDSEAEAAYRTAIRQKGDFVAAYINLGLLMEANGREEEALATWRTLLPLVDTGEPGHRPFHLQALSNLERLSGSRDRRLDKEATSALSVEQRTGRPSVAPPSASATVDTAYIGRPYGQADLDQKQDPKYRRYVLVAPPYQHNSAGIRVIYDLQKWLIRAGLDAIVCTWFNGYPVEQFEDDIVIYPEVAPGNLLKAKRVVRFILNVPGKLGYGETSYDPGEILVAYNPELAHYADGRMLQVPSIEPFFNDEGAIKSVDSVFVGKGRDLGLHPAECIAITKAYPASRRLVAQLLRSTRTLYMYDDFSMIAREAVLCGCDVRLIRADGATVDYPHSTYPTIAEFKAQLHSFIEMTKAL
ncbi:MAG: glycosyl transferase, family 2 [Rhizobacter sp.]|nr:glycosyl transferase, family 2 [Rhizobacter sp.]